jgi:CheY-like chemotaxis protein
MVVLFVDDDLEEYELFCEALKTFQPSTHCLHAKDGLVALHILERLAVLPNYIYLDINMPIMDGREFLKEIKADPRLKNIPVIMYSTTSNPSEISNLKKLGATDFVVKPPSFIQLVNYLKTTLV